MIYGVEAYLVDDLKGIVQNSKGQSLHAPYVVFDIETTGFSALKDKIIEIGAVKLDENRNIVDSFQEIIKPVVTTVCIFVRRKFWELLLRDWRKVFLLKLL